jgi:alpha-tubulin suppressor-like RCC1 family protein
MEVDGAVYCWGSNASGELGDGTQEDSARPVRVTGLPPAEDVVLGGSDLEAHSCAVLRDRRVACWGADSWGQAGDGEKKSSVLVPVIATGVEGARSISLGARHTCAALDDGSVKCWGFDGLDPVWLDPTTIEGLGGAKIKQVAAGAEHTCAVSEDGRVFCWGANNDGQCGQPIGELNKPVLPTAVPGIEGATAVGTGYYHTCAIVAGQVVCWGRNDCGQLGRAPCGDHCPLPRLGGCGDPVPTAPDWPAGPGPLTSDFPPGLGAYHSCVLRGSWVYCAGRNDFAQASEAGVPVVGRELTCLDSFDRTLIRNAEQFRAGAYHNCAKNASGSVRCWGRNDFGQLGLDLDVQW